MRLGSAKRASQTHSKGPFGYNWKLKLKTEEYCRKIIFKCVNSIVGSIFNEKLVGSIFNEKLVKSVFCETHEQCIKILFTKEKSKSYGLTKKKKKYILKCKRASGKRKTRFPNTLLGSVWIELRVCLDWVYCCWN